MQIPPKFLTLNVISGNARKDDSGSTGGSVEKENIYGIFEQEPRHFSRINNEKNLIRINDNPNETFVVDNFKHNYSATNKLNKNSQVKYKPKSKRNRKSVFNEINRRIAEIETQETNKNMDLCSDGYNDLFCENLPQNSSSKSFNLFEENLLWGGKSEQKMETGSFYDRITETKSVFQNKQFHVNPFSNTNFKNYAANSNFCSFLAHQLLDEGFQEEAVMECKDQMRNKILNLNNILRGRVSNCSKQLIKRFEAIEVNPDSLNVSLDFIPQSEWVFETPTRQKVVKPKLKKRCIQPAILYRNEVNHPPEMWDLKPEDVTIDMRKFEIPIPPPSGLAIFAKPAGCFGHNVINVDQRRFNIFEVNEPSSFAHSLEQNLSQQSSSMPEKNIFNFRPNFPVRNMFSNL